MDSIKLDNYFVNEILPLSPEIEEISKKGQVSYRLFVCMLLSNVHTGAVYAVPVSAADNSIIATLFRYYFLTHLFILFTQGNNEG